MVSLKRRTMFAGAAMGALAAPALLAGTASAQTAKSEQKEHSMPPQVNGFKLGAFQVVVVQDGIGVSDNPGQTFGTNQSPDKVAALLSQNFLPTDKFANGYHPVLIDTGSEVILFDTGFGEQGRAKGSGRLLEGLKLAGYQPEDVTLVVLTHLHGDHIGGLMEKGKPAFSKARYVTGRKEYEFWTDAARMGTPAEGGHKAVLANVKPLQEKFTFLADEGGEVVPGITAMPAFGHTPGHMIFRVESSGKALILTGDTANHYVLSLQRPDWEVRFDMDKAMAAATRKRVFDMIAAEKLPFLGYHMPFPSVGYVEKADEGYRFVPKSYQFDI
ncbi:MBL fold metallo-hydrolase [Rhizobium paknamense]|uniref:Glyoxylase-like metal-dependent hydrolase (Beta-lactamase superfamily II) n=1 Tax=Rhizobium paknamense TaxID=1206817 RepID=A0ABU0I9J7_9HYPH|nr:MBL fold metallo-hydrolase [Rhizobium paknamense]MDQ0454909.1 glyoxylase-like metal-dependent hydrolase (beta-lactamase superfamily II) [Rhizobium paknamense]